MKKALILLWIMIAGLSIVQGKRPAKTSFDQAEKILGENRIISRQTVVESWKKIGVKVELFSDTTLPDIKLIQKAAALNASGYYNIFLIPIFDLSTADLKKFYRNLDFYSTVQCPTGYRLINIPEGGESNGDLNSLKKDLPKDTKTLESFIIFQAIASLYLSGYYEPDGVILTPVDKNEFSLFSNDETSKNSQIVCGVIIRQNIAEVICLPFPERFTCNTISNSAVSFYADGKESLITRYLPYLRLTTLQKAEEFYINYAFSFYE